MNEEYLNKNRQFPEDSVEKRHLEHFVKRRDEILSEGNEVARELIKVQDEIKVLKQREKEAKEHSAANLTQIIQMIIAKENEAFELAKKFSENSDKKAKLKETLPPKDYSRN